LCEDFLGATECVSGEASTCRQAWTSVDESSGTVTFNNTPATGMGCTNTATYDVKLAKGTNLKCATTLYLGNYRSAIYMVGYWYFSATGLSGDGSSRMFMFSEGTSGSTPQLYITLQRTSDVYYVKTDHYNGSTLDQNTSVASVSAGNWYPFRITLLSESRVKVEFDFNNDGDFADANEVIVDDTTNIGNRQPRYILFGNESNETPSFTYEFWNIKIDDDTLPGLCSR